MRVWPRMRDMVRCALRDPVAGALGGELRRGSGEVKVVAVSDEEEWTVGTVVEGRGGGVGAGLLACAELWFDSRGGRTVQLGACVG